MKQIAMFVILSVTALALLEATSGCSEEKREKLLHAVSDSIRPEESGESTPDVVAKQQRRENVRQNRTWTPENQAKYPVEYCQAQAEKLEEHAATLEAGIHKINMAFSDNRRKIIECETRLNALNAFLNMAKAKYREAEANDAFPVDFNGYLLTRHQAQEKIVQASRQIPELRQQKLARENLAGQLEKKKSVLASEQIRVAALKEKVQNTINDLQTKKVMEGNKNLVDVLNALNDSIDSLSGDTSTPSLDDVVTPAPEASLKSEFDAIMGN